MTIFYRFFSFHFRILSSALILSSAALPSLASAGTEDRVETIPEYETPDSLPPSHAESIPAADTDGDGIPNYMDADIDGDGILNGPDGNGDGVTDLILQGRDLNGNGMAEDGTEIWPASNSYPHLNISAQHLTDIQAQPDPDIDGDGIPNSSDLDIDGDGMPNDSDRDMDGDGVANFVDVDMDADGLANSDDYDIDGDGISNANDSDMDGDGVPNTPDADTDGDGEGNFTDASPNGSPPVRSHWDFEDLEAVMDIYPADPSGYPGIIIETPVGDFGCADSGPYGGVFCHENHSRDKDSNSPKSRNQHEIPSGEASGTENNQTKDNGFRPDLRP